MTEALEAEQCGWSGSTVTWGPRTRHRVRDLQFLRAEGRVLSHAAFRLHGVGILNSIRLGNPGFITDGYLNAIEAETTMSALELVAGGLWERRPGGYAVVSGAMVTEL